MNGICKRKFSAFYILDHKGETIAKEICLLDWGIENLFTVTLDNAIDSTAIRHLKARINDWNGAILKKIILYMLGVMHIF